MRENKACFTIGRLLALCLAVAFFTQPASAQLPNAEDLCLEPSDELDPARYLRALSLDLRGDVPDDLETQATLEAGEVPDALIDEWLSSEAFIERVVRQHRSLLWNSVRNVSLLSANFVLTGERVVAWRRTPALTYRGASVPCEDVPATWDEDGRLITRLVDGARLEGFVFVRPYWDPAVAMKVCAFDAQETLFTSNNVACGSPRGGTEIECGCGPNLQFCGIEATRIAITESMAAAQDQIVRTLLTEGESYLELLTTRRAWVNGPLVHFWRHQAAMPSSVLFEPLPIDPLSLPELSFTDRQTWREIRLPEGHAGLLTQTAFLLRFQTQRARASRFYDAFLCQPFQPPPGGLPAPDSECSRNPDLQTRCGCRYCHALLEPSGAFWGRFGEQSVAQLSPERFPPVRPDCLACAVSGLQCSDECRRHYVTTALSPSEQPYLGQLKAYYFRRPEHARNIETGPALLVRSAVADHRLPTCVARRTAEWLLGRPLNLADEEQVFLDGLAHDFVTSGFDYPALVKRIVTHSTYRRVR